VWSATASQATLIAAATACGKDGYPPAEYRIVKILQASEGVF